MTEQPMPAPPIRTLFGTTPDGTDIYKISLQGGELRAEILTLGAIVQDLRLDGVSYSLVLGAPDLAPYMGSMAYFGALVGRYANRIGHARITLDNRQYMLDANWRGRHCLHGGVAGASARNWRLASHQPDRAVMELTLADGEMGFPGNMVVQAEISLPGQRALQIEVTARTDAATPCSFTHHGYFNLDGGGDVTGHRLWVDADAYLPVDADLIPLGPPAPVAGTALDYRVPRALGRSEIDHNFCLPGGDGRLRRVARLASPKSALAMTVETTEPGLQIYDGGRMPAGLHGLEGAPIPPWGGIALEPQAWPDAPNRPDFPPAILRPGQIYRHLMRYVFEAAPRG